MGQGRIFMQRMRRVLCAFILVAASAAAQSMDASEKETIQQLVQEVKELKAKVQALEAKQSGSEASAPNPPAAEETAPQTTTPSFLQEAHEIHGIQWRGFGEVNYKVLDQRQPEFGQLFGFVPGSAGNFSVGDFDLLLTSRISDKASVLSEVVIGEGDAQSFDVDLERVLFKYEFNDHVKVSFGRYHTGVGYYNTAFHTGKWLQTTADRPLIMEFADDGGLLPTQAVGVSVTGEIPSHGWGLNYTAEYGSSDTIRPDINQEGAEDDENNGNHINLGAFIRPDKFPGLQIGGSFYHDRISDFDKGPSVRLGQSIVNAHVVYNGHGIEFLNEGFLIRHAYEGSLTTYNMPAFYSLVSKHIGKFRPFFRYQYINANQNSIFDDVSLRHGPSFGSRYDFTDSIGIKLQLDHTLRKNLPDLNGLQTQLVFTF
jgi:hypothetical protein